MRYLLFCLLLIPTICSAKPIHEMHTVSTGLISFCLHDQELPKWQSALLPMVIVTGSQLTHKHVDRDIMLYSALGPIISLWLLPGLELGVSNNSIHVGLSIKFK